MALRIPFNPVAPVAGPVMGSPEVAASTAKTLGSLAGVVGDLATDLWQQGEEAQKVRNDKKLAELQTQVQKAAADYELSLIDNHNPETWGPGFNDAMTKVQSGLDINSLPPDVQGAFSAWNGQFQARQGLKLSRDARLFDLEQAKLAADNSVSEAVRMNDFDGARAIVNGLSSLTPEEKKSRVQKLDNMQVVHEANADIDSDPRGALNRLEAKNSDGTYIFDTALDLGQRAQLIDGAKRNIQRFQANAIKGITSDIEMGNIQSEEQLAERLKNEPYVEEGYHDEILFNYQQSQPLDADTRFGLVDALNDLHDAYQKKEISLDEYRVAHDGIAQTVYALGTREGAGALRQRVAALDPAMWNGDNLKQAPKDARNRDIERIAQTWERAGAFGKVTDEQRQEMAPAAAANADMEIYNKRAAFEDAMRQVIEKNPEISGEALSKEANRIYLQNVSTDILKKGSAGPKEILNFLEKPTSKNDPKGASSKISTEPVGGNLKEMVKHFEAGGEKTGFHAKAYWDYGQWSIGYGTKSKEGEVIDQAEAERRLDQELSVHKKRVLEANEKLSLDLKPHEIDALTSFDYNTGSLYQLLAGGSRSKAEIASKMLLYRNAKGKRLLGLERRRIAESTLFRRGYKAEMADASKSPELSMNTETITE